MAEISEEAQEQQYTSLSSSSSSPIAAPEVNPDEESLASVIAKKSPMPFLEAAKAEKWVKDAAQKTVGRATKAEQKPNSENGLDLNKYSWTRTIQDVTVSIPVPQGT